MKPSLSNAYARVRRANHHVAEIRHELPSLASPVIQWREEDKGVVLGSADHGVATASPIFGILVGEAVYNLRAALDYLVYELASLDSGTIKNGTQFPIEDSEKN